MSDEYLFGFKGVWHAVHADGTAEDIELAHGNLVEDSRGTVGQFVLSPPAPPPPFLVHGVKDPTPEELAKMEADFAEAVNDPEWRVAIMLPEGEPGSAQARLDALEQFRVNVARAIVAHTREPDENDAREVVDAGALVEQIVRLIEETA